MAAGKEITVKGKALRSKAGLMVQGVIILGFTPEQEDLYEGKMIEVTGFATQHHAPVYKPGEPISQGFEGQGMGKVIKVKMLE